LVDRELAARTSRNRGLLIYYLQADSLHYDRGLLLYMAARNGLNC
jgi:hypothetical protein